MEEQRKRDRAAPPHRRRSVESARSRATDADSSVNPSAAKPATPRRSTTDRDGDQADQSTPHRPGGRGDTSP